MEGIEHLNPLVEYLRARDLLREGHTTEAAERIEKAFGTAVPNSFLRRNLSTALDVEEPAGQILLEGIYGEVKWLQRKSASPRKRPS